MTKRMTTERLTQAQLEAIRKRALTSLGRSWYTELIETREDVTLLLAEVERLRAEMNYANTLLWDAEVLLSHQQSCDESEYSAITEYLEERGMY